MKIRNQLALLLLKPAAVVVYALAFAMLWPSLAIAQDQPFAWKFSQDDEFEVALTQTSEITSYLTLANLEDQEKTGRTATNTVIMDMQWKVNAVADDGTATMEQTVCRIRLDIDNGAPTGTRIIKVDTDSVDDQKGIAGKLRDQMKSMIGLSFELEMSARGEISNLVLPDETKEKLRQIPGSSMVRQMMDESALASMYGQAAVVLPETPMSESESWEEKASVQNSMGELTRTNKYTFDGLQQHDGNEVASFSIVTTLVPVTSTETSEEKPAEEIVQANRMVEFTGSGTMLLNVEAGHFESSKVSNVMTSEKDYFDKTIATTVTSDVEMTVNRK